MPDSVSGPGGLVTETGLNDLSPLVVMDFQDFEQSIDDQFGGEFFRGAMFAVGQLLGYGYAVDLPQPDHTATDLEATLTSMLWTTRSSLLIRASRDILHGQYLFRPDSTDIDLY